MSEAQWRESLAPPETASASGTCPVEFFVSGAGWVPTDIVAADGAAADAPAK